MLGSPSAGKAIAEVAHQHARLAQSIVTVRHALEQGGPCTQLAGQLDELIAVLAGHFGDEEALMVLRRYPATETHSEQHAAILLRVHALRAECDVAPSGTAPVLLNSIQQSVESHEANADEAFEQFIAELG